ncbi:hypothetical protein HanIR_Chr14g0717641 [Helianthus annuus]|nr:hypothetical protein HanIR_Chr14g0717641 [Helianthus annuus]
MPALLQLGKRSEMERRNGRDNAETGRLLWVCDPHLYRGCVSGAHAEYKQMPSCYW